MKFWTDLHRSQTMYHPDFGDALTFHLASSSWQNFSLSHKFSGWGRTRKEGFCSTCCPTMLEVEAFSTCTNKSLSTNLQSEQNESSFSWTESVVSNSGAPRCCQLSSESQYITSSLYHCLREYLILIGCPLNPDNGQLLRSSSETVSVHCSNSLITTMSDFNISFNPFEEFDNLDDWDAAEERETEKKREKQHKESTPG